MSKLASLPGEEKQVYDTSRSPGSFLDFHQHQFFTENQQKELNRKCLDYGISGVAFTGHFIHKIRTLRPLEE